MAATAGAAVMVVELGVARILTPVFGGSISVWAIVIATTMLALAAGYAVGGARADRRGGLRVAGQAAVAGAVLCGAIPFVRIPLSEATIGLPTLLGATIAAVVLIAPALFFLSQVSPALIRGLSSEGISHVGLTAGGIYAISTLGSLAGTLGAVWVFLYAPLAVGFLGTSALLGLAASALLVFPGLLVLIGALASLAMTGIENGVPMQVSGPNGESFTLVAKRNSAYGEIRVIDRSDRYRYMVVNGTDQGGIDRTTGRSAYRYDDGMVGLARLYVERPASALLIGLGPGVMEQRLRAEGVRLDVVEIDGEVVGTAREFFGYRGEAYVDDGRRFLHLTDHRWDVIFVDAFLGGNPPWQLYTKEAFASYRDHLNPGGVVVLNLIGSHLDPAQRPALEAVATTAQEVFRTVDVYPDPWEPDDYPTRNIYIAATNAPRLKPTAPGDPKRAESLSQALARSEPIVLQRSRTLTDGSAPLEPLVRRTTEILRSRTREYLPLSILIR